MITVGGVKSRVKQVANKDFAEFDTIRKGLADAVARYIASGEGDTVLTTLGAQHQHAAAYAGPWSGGGGASEERRALFAAMEPYESQIMARYAEVMGALYTAAKAEMVGSEQAPTAVRAFFSELCCVYHNAYRPPEIGVSRGLTAERALEVTRLLGGDAADIFDALYSETNRYGYPFYMRVEVRSRMALKELAAAHPEAVAKALSRAPAVGRVSLLNALQDWRLLDHPALRAAALDAVGDSAKAMRDAAIAALSTLEDDVIEDAAIERLSSGDAKTRHGMAQLLGRRQSERSIAALTAQLDVEKTARIRAAIETALAARALNAEGRPDDETGYTALDGAWVAIPPARDFSPGEGPTYGDADRDALRRLIAQENARIEQFNAAYAHHKRVPRGRLVAASLADTLIAALNAGTPKRLKLGELRIEGRDWLAAALARMPQEPRLRWALANGAQAEFAVGRGYAEPIQDIIKDYLRSPNGDIRRIEAIAIAQGPQDRFRGGVMRRERPDPGDLLRCWLQMPWSAPNPQSIPPDALWPYMAGHLEDFDAALGGAAAGGQRLNRRVAIELLGFFPKTPARFFAPLLEVATGETKAGRAEARALLKDAPEVGPRLLALLDDSREAIRAGAAEWLGARQEGGAVKALKTRLKKEKSDRARAAMLTALDRLGEDLGAYLGVSALEKQAEAGLKKASFDKIAWLGLDHLPKVSFRGGRRAPESVLRWWILQAFKLKQPGGNTLFDLYMDQLEPQSAAAFSTWILERWIAHDTAQPTDAEGSAHAKAYVAQNWAQMGHYYQSQDQLYGFVKAQFMSAYPNTGAPSKGLLGLARRAPPPLLAERVRAYLQKHGKRVSQASALLEMLAAVGDPTTLQVVISASTRLKQKMVQRHAAQLVERVAAEREWTLDELADRTIPTGGLEEDGRLPLPCGPEGKLYVARLDEALKLALFNPDGKSVKGLSAGQDENTAASKKRLSAAKRELKQVVTLQSARLYEALCAERIWPREDWTRFFRDHPVMRRLTERVVWLGVDAEGAAQAAFRPTAEGDYTDAEDEPVAIDAFAAIRVAHGALLADEEAEAWRGHLEDYEVRPLFPQFGRAFLKLSDEMRDATEIDDRKGWVTDAFTIRGAAAKHGYERGGGLDGGWFNEYRKPFPSVGLAAVIEFTGNVLPEENVPSALLTLRFERETPGERWGGGRVKLGETPPVLLSECWADYRDMAEKAAFDPEWSKRTRNW